MGERLNIEIYNNGKILANCYYHWSGYSDSAIELTLKALKNISDIKHTYGYGVLGAVKMLESTGAGLQKEDFETLESYNSKSVSINEAVSRNDGLISISDNNINDTRYCVEETISIYLDESRIDYSCVREDYDYFRKSESELVDWNLSDIKFNKLEEFQDFINSHLDKSFRCKNNPHVVCTCIH